MHDQCLVLNAVTDSRDGAAHERGSLCVLENLVEEVRFSLGQFNGLYHSPSEVLHGLRRLASLQSFVPTI